MFGSLLSTHLQQQPGDLMESPLPARPAEQLERASHPSIQNLLARRGSPPEQRHTISISSQVSTVLFLCQRLQLAQERGSLLSICVASGRCAIHRQDSI